ncbi:MAG: Endonuclease/Exonuclease/phosphatase family protein [Myxococcales bacterium]|nr:Endonuclease/Exonuclease/phosphatase family protein [Myxococcales bacterium]
MLFAVRLLPLLAVVLVALVASPSRAHLAVKAVRLMTYNLNYGNPDHASTLDAIQAGDADIVLLQEVTAEWRHALHARFKEQFPHQSYQVTARAAGGLGVLSKHPIKSEDVWNPPRGGWFPASRLLIESPLGMLQVLNVHLRPNLDGGSWVRGWQTTPPIRRREIEAYWQKIQYDLPTIVAGDFNDPPDGKAIQYLAKHGMTRVTTTGPTSWHYETVMDGRKKSLLSIDIDHVMIDSHLTASDARVLDAGTSDHRPVVVTLARR